MLSTGSSSLGCLALGAPAHMSSLWLLKQIAKNKMEFPVLQLWTSEVLKSRFPACILSGGFRNESVPFLSQLLEGTRISWCMGSSSILKAIRLPSSYHSHLCCHRHVSSDSDPPAYKDPYDDIGPTQIPQDNCCISKNVLHGWKHSMPSQCQFPHLIQCNPNPNPTDWYFPGGPVVKNPACKVSLAMEVTARGSGD